LRKGKKDGALALYLVVVEWRRPGTQNARYYRMHRFRVRIFALHYQEARL